MHGLSIAHLETPTQPSTHRVNLSSPAARLRGLPYHPGFVMRVARYHQEEIEEHVYRKRKMKGVQDSVRDPNSILMCGGNGAK
jgi:hypothetical protein